MNLFVVVTNHKQIFVLKLADMCIIHRNKYRLLLYLNIIKHACIKILYILVSEFLQELIFHTL
jgi:hypothetical protein